MKGKKRGVSPVVATVILIAMVIILAIIIFLWFRGLTKEAITKFDGQNVELLCEDVAFSASYSGGVMYISNDGVVPIYEMQIKASGEGSSSQINWAGGVWPKNGINSGNAMSGEILLSEFSGDAKEILLTPILLGTTEKGHRTYVCNEKKYGKEVSLE